MYESAKETLVTQKMPEKEVDYLRGYARALKDIISIPENIQNRMERERSSNYKEIQAAYEAELGEKELNN